MRQLAKEEEEEEDAQKKDQVEVQWAEEKRRKLKDGPLRK